MLYVKQLNWHKSSQTHFEMEIKAEKAECKIHLIKFEKSTQTQTLLLRK